MDCAKCTFGQGGSHCQRWSGGGKKAFDADGGDSDRATLYTLKFARSKRGPCGPDGKVGFEDHARAKARWDRELNGRPINDLAKQMVERRR